MGMAGKQVRGRHQGFRGGRGRGTRSSPRRQIRWEGAVTSGGQGFPLEASLQYSKVTVLTRRYSFKASSPARRVPLGNRMLATAPPSSLCCTKPCTDVRSWICATMGVSPGLDPVTDETLRSGWVRPSDRAGSIPAQAPEYHQSGATFPETSLL